MGAKKISALAAAALPLTGAERLAGVQDGATVGFTVAEALQAPFAASGASAERTLAERCAEAVNVRDFGAGQGDAAADTAAIKAAYAAAVAAGGAPSVYFPPGAYAFQDDELAILADSSLFYGQGATVRFVGSGLWKIGSDAALVAFPEFRDLAFVVDATSSVEAPVSVYNCGRAVFQRVAWHDIKASAISLRRAVLWLRHCDTRMAAGGGSSVIKAAIPATLASAIFIQGGRFNSADHAAKLLVDHSGAGEIDGLVLIGVNTAGLDGVVRSAPASGGHLSNCVVQGGLFDQVDQRAFWFAPAAGAALNDVFIGGGAKINGRGDSTSTADIGLITLDLSSGAAHGDYPFVVSGCVLANARRRAIEVLGGTYRRVVISRNVIAEYGMSADAASRAIHVASTASFDSLEIADNAISTSYVHDYGVQIATGATAAKAKVDGNTHAGLAAGLADINTRAFASRREALQADRTYYVRTDGSDSNAGLVNSAAGAFLTRQAAWDALARLDLNGFNVTVQVADGTYTGGLTATRVPVGNGTVTIQGNLTTWSNVAINTTATDCFRFPTAMAATVLIQGFKLTTTTSGRCIIVVAPVQVQFNKIEFGACATQHLNATNAGSMLSAATGASYTISSSVTAHVSAQRAGQVALSGATITFSGSLTLGNFLIGSDAGMILATAMSWVGTFTGGRAAANSSSLIDNGGANNIPGTTGPVTATGGQYI